MTAQLQLPYASAPREMGIRRLPFRPEFALTSSGTHTGTQAASQSFAFLSCS
jgi:hypothetical protein